MSKNKQTIPILSGRKMNIMGNNPNRGFRYEISMDAASGVVVHDRIPVIPTVELIKDMVADYKWENPRVAQMYVYLSNYTDKPLDALAINNIQKVFDRLREYNLTALLLFSYSYDLPHNQEAPIELMLEHIKQLRDVFYKNRNTIHAIQAGFIGYWGEWGPSTSDANSRENRALQLRCLLENTPDEIFIQVRYIWAKNLIDKNDPLYKRVSFMDMYIGPDNPWSVMEMDPESSIY